MARSARPEADPVSITNDHRVNWYPSGWVGVGPRKSRRCRDRADAETFATATRIELDKIRAAARPRVTEPAPNATVIDSVESWLGALEQDPGTPTGTVAAYRSRANRLCAAIGGNRCGELNEQLWRVPLRKAVEDGCKRNTLEALATAMRAWRSWAHEHGWLPPHVLYSDKALNGVLRDEIGRLERRDAATVATASIGTSVDNDGDDDEGIRLSDVPSWATIEALGDALARRESGPPPHRVEQGQSAKGGRRRLSAEEAWRIGQGPLTQAATGLRLCELLALHSNDIDPNAGVVRVARQLDRYRVWLPGEDPPVCAPKGGKSRRTRVFEFYLPTLTEVCAYADEHHGGFLFAPTAGQRRWADAYRNALVRAADLMAFDATPAPEDGLRAVPPVWSWPFHYLRHHYGSYALAPVNVGGYGWSLKYTSQCMGHRAPSTTERAYIHTVDGEDAYARSSSRRPPGASTPPRANQRRAGRATAP